MELSYIYIDVLLPLPLYGTFTYAVNSAIATELKPGVRVKVPFGKNKIYIALVIRQHNNKPAGYQVKEIAEILDFIPVVVESQLQLWRWISEYYLCSEGEVYKAAMPLQLNLESNTRKKKTSIYEINELSTLNEPQEKALQNIKKTFVKSDVVLLHGVTSSGKTEIYIHLINEIINSKKQVLYLLPEIALTTQIITRLQTVFGPRVAVYHSKYSNSQRKQTWKKLIENVETSDSIQIILGVRSAIFLPFKNLGLIIVDEEHENTFKQFDPAPRYHARDTAIMLAKFNNAKVLLGTATPSIETYYNCKTGKFGLVELNERYLNLQLPEIILVNTLKLRHHKQMTSSDFSPQLVNEIENTLKEKKQVILFQNRRGFAVYLECEQCGELPRCRYCDVSLTYHKKTNRLHCHYCGYSMKNPESCPVCHGDLHTRGMGTEKIEEEVSIFFPEAKVERLDTDAAKSRKSYEKLIERFETNESDILVGTQMVSKGLDFGSVKLVGIMNADTLLNYPDFRAHERSYQLMSQVSGRAGRKDSRGKVVIQTSDDSHPIIKAVINNDYKTMFSDQISERKKFNYPPFSRLVKVTIKHHNISIVDRASDLFVSLLRDSIDDKIMGPEYPLVSRIQNLFLKDTLIKIEKLNNLSDKKKLIVFAAKKTKQNKDFRSVQIIIDVDPQ